MLSTTPGKRLAEYTVKHSEKQAARTGALPVLIVMDWPLAGWPPGVADVGELFGTPTLTKEKRKLQTGQQDASEKHGWVSHTGKCPRS